MGVTVDEALAAQLIADAAGESGVLPLVQETFRLLWDKVVRRHLGLAAYRGMAEGGRSGLQVAIDRRANLVYDNLPHAAQPIARRIFLRLIQFGEGRADTRRQQTVAELRASGDDPALFDSTLARLIESRLLTASGEAKAIHPSGGHRARGVDRRLAAVERVAGSTPRRPSRPAADWRADSRMGGGGVTGGRLDEYELHEAENWLGADTGVGVGQDLVDLVAASKEAIAQVEAKRKHSANENWNRRRSWPRSSVCGQRG